MNVGWLFVVVNFLYNDVDICDNYDNNGGDFEEGELKFQFVEYFDVYQVDGVNDQYYVKYLNLVWYGGELDFYINVECGYVSNGDDQDFKIVGLVGNVVCKWVEVFLCIV